MKHSKRGVKNLVKTILEEDKKARNSDRYLYVEVVKRLNPELAVKPLKEALMIDYIPSYETVSRSRRWCQEKFKWLRASSEVEAMRELEEEDYRREFAGANGR